METCISHYKILGLDIGTLGSIKTEEKVSYGEKYQHTKINISTELGEKIFLKWGQIFYSNIEEIKNSKLYEE